jgi:hypothetical protein
MKKLWIVKREVWAHDVTEAAKAKGKIYEVTMADEKYQPEEWRSKKLGFKKK